MSAIVLVGHGSRVPAANQEFLRFVALFRAATSLLVEPGFVELAEPTLPQALARAAESGAREVAVLPFVLFAAGHVKSDIPLHIQAARTRYPRVRFVQGAPIGLHSSVLEILSDRVREAQRNTTERADEETAILLVGRGSSDPDANSDLAKLGRLFWEGRAFAALENAFCGVARPLVPEGLRRLARLRPKRIILVPSLFFAGVLEERLRANIAEFRRSTPWVEALLASPIGVDPRLIDIVLDRHREALNGTATMTCDLCKYKVALTGFEDEVGGEKALLRSIRHATLTAAPTQSHAHAPIRKHLLICVNSECVAQGSAALVASLRQKLKHRNLDVSVQTTKTSCLRRCGDGPLLVVYPDGVWYRRVCPQDLDEIVDQHLCAGRPVGRLLDQLLTP
ncbi:MAG TPA: CbiX/SirB N-terminal domain-containing protein [Methylomirabilota bacterium]|nr:CbiX/SirB N-terminal domain-containing protein [Methylomirabilota bacterium]